MDELGFSSPLCLIRQHNILIIDVFFFLMANNAVGTIKFCSITTFGPFYLKVLSACRGSVKSDKFNVGGGHIAG